MARPPVTRTLHPLPFEKLSPSDFERLCLWLVEREGWLRPQHFGEAGSEQGRDVIAWKATATGEQLWYFQCKRYRSLGAKTCRDEVEKYEKLAITDPAKRPYGIVFVTNAVVSAAVREQVTDYCQQRGYDCHFWAHTELDMYVKNHPDIIEEFFAAHPPPEVTALHQLSPPPRDFTGRTAELDALITAWQSHAATIFGVHGSGGVGKTAFALRVGEMLEPYYAEAQFYLDLKGNSAQPLPGTEAMAEIIRAYHPTLTPPDNNAALSALYRSVLHNKRVLLLLDNAKDAAQIEPLLPSKSCLVLVTSRQRFTLPGMQHQYLDKLPQPEATCLLLKIAPRIRDQADKLAALCGYLPLALRLVGRALAVKVNIKPADYAVWLEDAQQRLKILDEVEAAIRLSYDVLPSALQNLWCSLAVFPETFDDQAAAAVWGLDMAQTQEALSQLLLFSLIEYNEVTGRYRLHDLMRLFADARLHNPERTATQRRHAMYYQSILAKAHNLYRQPGYAPSGGLELFDQEWGNIQTGQAWAATHASNDNVTAKLCSDYPGCGGPLLDLRQQPRARLPWFAAALEAAIRLGDRRAQAVHLGGLGIAHWRLGEVHRAKECYEAQLSIARELHDFQNESAALGNLGTVYRDLGHIREAIRLYDQQLTIARAIHNHKDIGNALNNLGSAYYSLSDFPLALRFYEQGLAVARLVGDRLEESNALGNLGNVYWQLHEMPRAVEYYQQQRDMAQQIGNRRGEAAALTNLGTVNYLSGQINSTIEQYTEVLTIYRDIGDLQKQGLVLGNLGNVYSDFGELDQAIKLYEQSLDLARQIGDQSGEGKRLYNLSLALDRLGKRAEAIAHAQAALAICEQIEDTHATVVREKLQEWQVG